MPRVGLNEIAKRLGVDRSTVSRALSADKSHLVSETTREAVRAAALEVGYRPDQTAAGLRRGRTDSIGILVSDLENETFTQTIRAVVAEFAREGQSRLIPLIGETRDASRMTEELIETFLSRRVDAILTLASSDRDAEVLRRAAREVPVVLGIRAVSALDLPTFVCDDVEGGAMMARHFHAQGHRTVCQIRGPDVSAVFHNRAEGFSAECQRLGLAETGSYVARAATVPEGSAFTRDILFGAERPTAIFTHNDALAVGFIEAARTMGKTCPGDFAIGGYNNTQLSRVLAVPLTTVDFPWKEIADHASTAVLRQIGDREARIGSRTFAGRLLVRASSDQPRGSGVDL